VTGSTLASKLRALAVGAGAFAALFALAHFLPNSEGGSGTPVAILFLALVVGLCNSLVAAGVVLVYRTSRIINFAQGTIGAAGGVFTYNLVVDDQTTFPFIPALIAGLIVAGIVGVAVELLFVRRFFNAPRLVLTVVTIALIQGVGSASGFIQNLPFFTAPEERTLEQQLGQIGPPLPFPDFSFRIGDFPLGFDFGHVFAVVASILGLLGLAAFFRFTKAGVAVRAAAENNERAELLGINVKGLSTLVWGITGVLSGLSVIVLGVITSFGGLATATPQGSAAAGGIMVALAAAVIAKMRSLPVAVGSAVGLEIARQVALFKFDAHATLFDAGLFLVILFGLLVQRKSMARGEGADISSWEATQEVRPTPKEMLEVSGIRIWRRVLVVVAILAALLYPWAVPAGPANVAGFVAIQGIVLLSLVVLTGWAGQVSLGQWALVGVGALIAGALTTQMNVSFWLAIPIVIVATALFATVIGLPALRIKGLYLAITTFAMAFAIETNLFSEQYFGWAIPDEVRRPTLFLFDFEDERSMYYLAIIAFGLCVLLVTSLRRTRPGRILIGLRENEPNLESFGVNLLRARLSAFALAGALAGFAGVLLAHHQRDVGADAFPATQSLEIFIFAIIGGIGSVAGAILGGLYLVLDRVFAQNPLLQLIIGPLGVLLILYAAPGGLSSILFGLRDGLYRIIAQRRRMIVPSLFADLDPAAMARQLAPLAEPVPNTGLGALP